MSLCVEDLAKAIAALQSEIRGLIEHRADTKVVSEKLAQVDRLEAEYLSARDRDLKRMDAAIQERISRTPSATSWEDVAADDARSSAIARWNGVLTVWQVGQKWRRKAKHTKLRGDATRLLKKLEQKEAMQSEISDLRAALYALRQRKNLTDEDVVVKRRLEEQLRIAESDMKQLLLRDPDAMYVRYSTDELNMLHKLETGTTMFLLEKQGKSKPVTQLFTLDPFTGSILWGDDRDANVINSALVTGIDCGAAAMLCTKYIPDSQLRYSMRLRIFRAGEDSFLFLVACNQEEYETWTNGVKLVVDRLRESPASTPRVGSALSSPR